MEEKDPIIQYIVLRKDLLEKPINWPFGSVATQTCHASVGAIAENLEDKETQIYISKEYLNDMHKVVLKVDNEKELLKIAQDLTDNNVKFKLWKEKPEMVNTCLATKPYLKSTVSKFFKTLKLFKV